VDSEHVIITHRQDPKESLGRRHVDGTPLHVALAVALGHTTTARLLSEHTVDVNARDEDSMTVLHNGVI